MHNFPTLFKKAKDDKVSQWDISVSSNVIYIVHGFVDGKKQKDTRLIKAGKNIGRENATTSEEQAFLEAQSKWNKQIDKGYRESINESNELIFLPMLAQRFDQRKHYIKYPCYAQIKADGTRVFAKIVNGNVSLTTRHGKTYPHLEHLFEDIKKIPNIENILIDGELYSEELPFTTVVGLVKKQKLNEEDKELSKKIKLFVFDCVLLDDFEATFESRYDILKKIFNENNFNYIVVLDCEIVHNENEAMECHKKFVAEGAEGLILRNKDGRYEFNKRSNDLQKYKHFLDDEFEICGFEEGTGRDRGTVIWVCKTKNNYEFNVRPKGSEEERKYWFRNGDKFIGKKLTVRYQELNLDTGCPRFPVGVNIREDY